MLDAAEAIFRDIGVRDAAIADIARLAEVGPATIYRMVKDKDTLFQWTLLRAWDPATPIPNEYPLLPIPGFEQRFRTLFDLDARLPVTAATAAGRAHKLRPVLEEHFDFEVSQTRWLDLYQAAAADDEHERFWFDHILQPMAERTADALRHLEAVGEIAPGWPHLPAAFFIVVNTAFFGRTGLRQDPVLDPEPSRHRASTIRRLERALRLPPAASSRG